MEIITSHTSADFDSLAAMAAAKRLYPAAEPVLAEPLPRALRACLEELWAGARVFRQAEDIPLADVTRLILVDTRRRDRLGALAACLDNPGLDIHIYDHHPAHPDDIRGAVEHIAPCGATSTLMARILAERGVPWEPGDCTLLMLGIYENTGGLLGDNTTPEDLEAAALLLGRGADLAAVSRHFSREPTERQRGLLARLQQQCRSIPIHGVSVAVARIAPEGYIDNLGVLARRCLEADNLNALFALADMGGATHLACRSRVPEVNAGAVARALGGDGHAAAGAAVLAGMTLDGAEERLLAALHELVRPRALAREIMSAPVIAITPELSVRETARLMTRYNVAALPVARRAAGPDGAPPRGLLGVITRAVAEKGIYHNLGDAPAADYMTTGIAALPEDAGLADIQRLVVDRRQRLVPVVAGERGEDIVGVITRTDLLGLVAGDPVLAAPELPGDEGRPSARRDRNLGALMAEVLPRDVTVLLRRIGETAEALRCRAFAAGGFVRDLLLRRRNMDIDIVVEGDGLAFAGALARELGGVAHPHEKFRTATVALPDGARIDVATARLEYYERPAALPTVETGSIKLDLSRRDFTINAMALHLNPERFGLLADYFNSQNDLMARRIQVLHNLSFVEDPTRIFRALRFESRLGFRITRLSEKLIRGAVRLGLPERIEGHRILHELQLILSEDDPLPALLRMEQFGLFGFIRPELRDFKLDRRLRHELAAARRAIACFRERRPGATLEQWLVYVLALTGRADAARLDALCRRLEMPDRQRRDLAAMKDKAALAARELHARPGMRPAELCRLLADLNDEALLHLVAAARKSAVIRALEDYLVRLKDMRPLVGGARLKELGYRPGPRFSLMHRELLDRQRDGEITTAAEAERFLLERFPPDAENGPQKHKKNEP